MAASTASPVKSRSGLDAHEAAMVFGGVWLTLFALFYPLYLWGLEGYLEPRILFPLGRDFINVWTAGNLVLQGRTDILADIPVYAEAQRILFDVPTLAIHNWSYPPHLLAFTVPFGALPYPLAFVLWTFGGIAAFGVATLSGLERRQQLTGALILSPVVLLNIFYGQNGLYTAALALGAWRCLDRRPVLAGVMLAILTIKPQLGLLFALMLVIERRWLVIAVASAGAVALVLVSLALFGLKPWQDWLGVVLPFQRALAEIVGEFSVHWVMMPTSFVALRLLDVPAGLAYGAQLLTALGVLGLVFAALVSRDRRTVWTAALIGGVCLSPYLFIYDLGVVTGALWFLLKDRPRLSGFGNWLALVGFLLPFLAFLIPVGGFMLAGAFDLPVPMLQIGPVVLVALVAWVVFGRRANVMASGEADVVGDDPRLASLAPAPMGAR